MASTTLLHGSDYFEGQDGVRRLYGPGLFDFDEQGRIIGPHFFAPERSQSEQQDAKSEQTVVQEVPPVQDGSGASQPQIRNGG